MRFSYAGTWRGLSVAIKSVFFNATGNRSMQLAAEEASIAYNLHHPCIVTVYSH